LSPLGVFWFQPSVSSTTIFMTLGVPYATPSANGAFAIDAVAPGTYQLSAWHERIGETTKSVQVAAGEDASVEFSLPVVER
jgi:hypothetical protein